ncbi:MAG: sigma-70 family RNA polymerase sigma factor [Ignavibacteria bacterium]|nr:sigma-70 family RNA polymerase sigma factor [Ignavibacteria bacterium]
MARVSNQQIVRELKAGDRIACRHLVDMYQSRLLAEAISLFHVPQLDAEELVNDVLLAVVSKIHSFEFKRSDGDFHNWVMTIFRNRVRDVMRRHAFTDGLYESYDESALENEQAYTHIERDVVRSILHRYEESARSSVEEGSAGKGVNALQVVAETLDAMESWERVLLRCRSLEVPYEQIARYTGKSVKYLKVYHARVKKKFLKLLTQRVPNAS